MGRDAQVNHAVMHQHVSIHAPTWGATQGSSSRGSSRGSSSRVSIHAPTWGATQDKLKEGLYSQKFQSTRPRGARRSPLLQGRYICASFNPRAHVGRDLECGVGLERLNVSIHAPTWGATQDILSPFISCPVSIHAPTWGATFIHWWLSVHLIVSIHAPTWGAT